MSKFVRTWQLAQLLLVTAVIVLALGFPQAISAQIEPTAAPQGVQTGSSDQSATGDQPDMPDGSALPSSLSEVAWADVVELALSTLVIVLVAVSGGRLIFALLQKGVRRTA